MGRKKTTPLQAITYLIELAPATLDMYLSFPSRYDGQFSTQLRKYTVSHISLTGTLCTSTSRKVKPTIPVNITIEASDDEVPSVEFSIHKGTGNSYCYLRKEYFFHVCSNLKDGTIKYLELSGDELVRGSAAIGNIDFMTSPYEPA